MKFEKIIDKELNLEVKGQADGDCWHDCWFSGQWKNKANMSTPGCDYTGEHWGWQDNPFS